MINNMKITSDEIRELIKTHLDADRGYFSEKLYKTKAIKDSSFYAPSPVDLKHDFEEAKIWIARDFAIAVEDVKSLATNPFTIWDCDNMARDLRTKLNKLHFRRYLQKKHNIDVEYAAFQVTDQRAYVFSQYPVIHDFIMIFTENGIYFADLMQDKVWSIDDFKPAIISIGE